MPSDRFFTDSVFGASETVLLEGAEHHHLAHVIRLSVGEEAQIVNGRGDLGLGKIIALNRSSARIEVLHCTHSAKPQARYCLGTPIMRAAKIEWIVEKGTELGIDTFYFYEADHSEKGDFSTRQRERLRVLSISALKQSGRLYLPSLEIVSSLSSLFSIELPLFFGDLGASESFSLQKIGKQGALFITGPERGFSSEEVDLLKARAEGVLLNRNILRAETAAIAAASLLGACSTVPLSHHSHFLQ